jgi:hypothetical protein
MPNLQPITLSAEQVEALLEELEQARDILREEPCESEAWPLSWSLEGWMYILRGEDPLGPHA